MASAPSSLQWASETALCGFSGVAEGDIHAFILLITSHCGIVLN